MQPLEDIDRRLNLSLRKLGFNVRVHTSYGTDGWQIVVDEGRLDLEVAERVLQDIVSNAGTLPVDPPP